MCPCIKNNSAKNLLFIFNDKKVMTEKDAKKVRSATLFWDTFKNNTFSKESQKNNMHTALLKVIENNFSLYKLSFKHKIKCFPICSCI